MDRVFLDANVLFSAAWGSPDFLLLWKKAGKDHIELLASPYVIEEARRNLEGDPAQRLEELLETLRTVSDTLPGMPCPLPLPSKDEPVLVAAIAAGATHLLSGDRKAFEAHYRRSVSGVLILPPAEYLSGR